jgi:hypothetical protein
VSAPQLRPLGIGEILDVGLKIFWRNAGTLIRAVVVVVLPVQILSVLIVVSSVPDGFRYSGGDFGIERTDPFAEASGTELAALITGGVFVIVLALASYLLSTGACYRAIVSAYLGEATSWRDSLRYALRRAHSLLWISFLVLLVVALGLVACIVPGIYLGVAFSVAVPVLLTEGTRGKAALGRSRRLVSGFWWRCLGVLVLSGILVGIVGFAISGIAAAVTSIGSDSSTLALAAQQIVTSTVSSVITTPLTAAFTTILYFDLRVRKEAFDLWLLAERLGVEPPPGYTAPAPQAGGLWASGSEQPPYWPPPPGWQPSGGGSPQPPPAPSSPPGGGEQPPFWPPPPGWKPSGATPERAEEDDPEKPPSSGRE